jgi:phosphoglycolate phosphatase-like HAD superfamily hydrolase
MKPLETYQTFVFDCDGVIMNSNGLKIQAYYDVAVAFGATDQQAQALVEHHVALGGVSRYPKFEYFLRQIMHVEVTDQAMNQLLENFTAQVKMLLADCEIAPCLDALKKATPQAKWMVISGGDQTELREIFKHRGLDGYFEAGIFGSPDNKDEILSREIFSGNLTKPAIFIGDSRYDSKASASAGLDFVFLSDWTDVKDWSLFCEQNHIEVKANLTSLLS